jgi:hypothetical protein
MGVLIEVIAFQVLLVSASVYAKLADYIPFNAESKEKGGTGQIPRTAL